ncbi:putative immunity protein [Novipirellula maiorica]|uniref:putative immunity protein n=1 Tax=Novipirellula maiorica TaxID=1265734 RepID=UPI000592ABD8
MIQLAAELGDPEALSQLGDPPQSLPEHYRSRIEQAVQPLTTHQRVAFACECASRVQHYWLAFNSEDSRPADAIAAATGWLRGELSHDFAALSSAASDAGVTASEEFDRIEGTTISVAEASPLGRAIYSAEWAAVAAHSCTDIISDPTEECYCCAYAAKAAVWATHDNPAEREWQAKRLCDFLLGRA